MKITAPRVFGEPEPIYSKRLGKIVEAIGENVKKLEIKYGTIGEKEFSLFRLMPKLQELVLDENRADENLELPDDFKFNHLKVLKMILTSSKLDAILDHLPDNGLQKFTTTSLDYEWINSVKRITSIEDLHVSWITEESINTISTIFPKLRRFSYKANRDFDTDEVFGRFSCLESLHFEAYKMPEVSNEFKNYTVKHLQMNTAPITLICQQGINAVVKLVKSFKNMKTLSINGGLHPSLLRRLLTEGPKLESLCLTNFTLEQAQIIMEYGDHLKVLHLQHDDELGESSNIVRVKEALIQHFPMFYKLPNVYHGYRCYFKKPGKAEICCENFKSLYRGE